MYGIYGDTILAQLIARERISHRENIQVEIVRHPLTVVNDLIDTVVHFVKRKLQEPNLFPVYCFEYAPDCA